MSLNQTIEVTDMRQKYNSKVKIVHGLKIRKPREVLFSIKTDISYDSCNNPQYARNRVFLIIPLVKNSYFS